jgi:hypothetical protein
MASKFKFQVEYCTRTIASLLLLTFRRRRRVVGAGIVVVLVLVDVLPRVSRVVFDNPIKVGCMSELKLEPYDRCIKHTTLRVHQHHLHGTSPGGRTGLDKYAYEHCKPAADHSRYRTLPWERGTV